MTVAETAETAETAEAAQRRIFRAEFGRLVAALARQCGDYGEAEEAVQAAFEAALPAWVERRVPPDPRHVIQSAARDLLRRKRLDGGREPLSEAPDAPGGDAVSPEPTERDDEAEATLAVALLCSHDALPAESRVVLMLRYLGGLTLAEIAAAFGTRTQAIDARLDLARPLLRDLDPAPVLPAPGARADRLTGALAVLQLIYDQGYAAAGPAVPGLADSPVSPAAPASQPEPTTTTAPPVTASVAGREGLCLEAVRLAAELHRAVPTDPEVQGLLGLLTLLEARRPARLDGQGRPVSLAAQDRALWDRELIAAGQRHVQECLRVGRPGPYQIHAAIQAIHCAAASDADTDWGQILALYDQLTALTASPAVAARRAVAVAHVLGPEAGLAALQAIPHADRVATGVRAELLARLGRADEAAVAVSLGVSRDASAAAVGLDDPGLLGHGDPLSP